MHVALADMMRRRAAAAGSPDRQQQQHQQQQDGGGAALDEETGPLLARKAGALPGAPPRACSSCGAGPGWSERAAARCRPGLAFAIVAVYIAWPLLRYSGALPPLAWRLATVAGLLTLGQRVLTFRRWGDEHPYVGRFLAAFVAMIVELLFENCMVWIVSATDLRKYEDVPALQDNAEILFSALAARGGPAARWALYGDWVHTKEFLLAALAVAFSVAYDQIPYSGFGVMTRFCATIAAGRLLRVACFMTTVLPNPRPGCYARRFPPPPGSAWESLRVGFTTLRGMGGCNDLIFSGHGAFWTLTPLLLHSYYPGRPWVGALVWAALVQTSVRDFLEHMHYSVDMLVAVIATAATWTWLRGVYPQEAPLAQRPEGAPPDAANPFVLGLIAFTLVVASFIILVAKA